MRTNEELIADYRAGDADALNELAKQNRGLIGGVARHWCKRSRHWDDTFQDCSLAFLLAAHQFEPSRQRKFSTFATTVMRNYMQNLVVHREAQKRKARTVPLKVSLRCQSPMPFEVVSDRLDAQGYLKRIRPARTRKVVWLRMQGYTFPEIGKLFGVSLERARQITKEGMELIGTSGCEWG